LVVLAVCLPVSMSPLPSSPSFSSSLVLTAM
jgi:hypothetical protein